MAEKSYFFNSDNGDRKYKAEDFAEYFGTLIGNGVFPNPSTGLQVISNEDLTVTVPPGKAWINGHLYHNPDNLVFTLTPANATLNRIDRIVTRLYATTRDIKSYLVTGTAAANPTAPALTRTGEIYELALADIYVGASKTVVLQANITDTRGSSDLCGIVSGLIKEVDTTTLFNQYLSWYSNITVTKETEINNLINSMETEFQSAWDTWFAGVQAALAGDVAGNLLAKIENLIITSSTAPTNPTANSYWYKVL